MSLNKQTRRDFFQKAGLMAGISTFGDDNRISNGVGNVSGAFEGSDSTRSVFPVKPYFPFILGNGEEHILTGFSGSMGACAGHEHWQYNGIPTGWYKPDRSQTPGYGVVNLLQCGYFIMKDYHAIGIDSFTQEFDHQSGCLVTHCEFANIGSIKVTTYLTSTHFLVHQFSPNISHDGLMFQFFAKGTGKSGTAVVDKTEDQKCIKISSNRDSRNSTEFELFSDIENAKIVDCYNGTQGFEVPISGNQEFAFFLRYFEDDRFGYSVAERTDLSRKHVEEWKTYQNKSGIEIGHKSLDRIYHISLYVIRAHQHPEYGSITIGSYAGMWKNTVYSWDMAFSIMALLGANRLDEVEKALVFWKHTIPNLERMTREAGLTGAAVRSGLSITGEVENSTKEEILSWRHTLSADVPIFVWQLYLYSGKVEVLKKYWDCMYKPLLFLMEHCVEEFDHHAEIIRSPGTNGKERIDGKYVYFPNPTITLLTTIEALSGFIEAAHVLKVAVDPSWIRLLPKLKKGVEENRFDGILLAAKDSRSAITKAIHEVGLFGVEMDKDTIQASMRSFRTKDGFYRWDNHGYKAIPWINTYVSAALSQSGLPGASEILLDTEALTTTTFGFPEAVRPDGVFHKTWYPTVHASFVHSFNLLLLKRKADVIEVFSGIPEEWGNVSFSDLRIPFGLLVSATRSNRTVRLGIKNTADINQNVVVRTSRKGKILERKISIRAGSSEEVDF